ncbi:PTS sugar transporter subunit IIC [Erysipelothrix urinaevulpis]|uniref:PTS mannose/fructose/sorbose/N-acetylgalactosamine transporter subunit IIC n=1 Tax=Erysipelothrix urinaevulpis TaxID=2683717 RepID=UPI0013583341|nr:PTS sugar transporter subunit IIC [Erysipelothrix urinaevulpis]
MITTMQAVMLGLVLFVTFGGNWLTGQSMLDRPIVVAPLVGLVFNDLQTGIIIGASLEALFMGAVNIGGAAPINPSFGTLLSASFALATQGGVETALALALPLGLFGGALETVAGIIMSLFVNKQEELASQGKVKEIVRMHYGLWFGKYMVFGIIAAILVKIGLEPVKHLMDISPEWIIHGFQVAGGLLPGLGFAMLLKLLWDKKLAVFYLLGFVLAAYFNIPLIALAVIGFALVYIIAMQSYENLGSNKAVDVEQDEVEGFFDV